MKNSKIGFLFAAVALTGLVGCDDSDNNGDDDDMVTPDAAVPVIDADTTDADPMTPDAGPMNVDVTVDITANTTWTFPNIYFLKKHVFVKNGATLTIEPGVIVKGEPMTSLVITREGKIDAQGTAVRPIVFTSAKDVGTRVPGDWGGVVLLGKAILNTGSADQPIEGFPADQAETKFGGTDNAHDCGKLKYVRVEFAGFELAPTKELNGLTVGGCGSATSLDFIQIHQGSDDGMEFFGGTVGLTHAVITQGQDDGLDWDFGWTGKVQFLVIQIGNNLGENGFEADNHPTAFDSVPRSSPVIYNTTIIGPDTPTGAKRGMLLRRGTAGQILNTIVYNVGGVPIDVRDASTVLNTPATLFVKNSIFFQNAGQANWVDATDNDGNFDEAAYFRGGALNNKEVDPQLPAAATSLTAPSFKPAAASPALLPANAATPPAGFDTTATFIGGVGADDWTAGWTAYPQN